MTTHVGTARYTVRVDVKARRGRGGRRDARALIRWFNAGADGQIVWGAPGDLTACHRVASRHMSSAQAWAFCNTRHRDVLGTWNDPNEGKADLGARERERLARQGRAMPGGRFPIRNRSDLENAIDAVGRARPNTDKERAKVRRYILKRARALGLSALIPDTWNADGSLRG